MIKVLIADTNHYHKLGLSLLITEQLSKDKQVYFLISTDKEVERTANIIFRDIWVTLNLFSSASTRRLDTEWFDGAVRMTAHTPFLVKNDTLKDISARIWKIINIITLAKDSSNTLNSRQWPKSLLKHQQLSVAENDILLLIGRGFSDDAISKILNRSRKTVCTHYRNASRKLGLVNRAEFYKYACFIAHRRKEERHTLCL